MGARAEWEDSPGGSCGGPVGNNGREGAGNLTVEGWDVTGSDSGVCVVCVCVYVRYMHNIHYTYMNITYGIEKLSMHLFCDINICLSFLTM